VSNEAGAAEPLSLEIMQPFNMHVFILLVLC